MHQAFADGTVDFYGCLKRPLTTGRLSAALFLGVLLLNIYEPRPSQHQPTVFLMAVSFSSPLA